MDFSVKYDVVAVGAGVAGVALRKKDIPLHLSDVDIPYTAGKQ